MSAKLISLEIVSAADTLFSADGIEMIYACCMLGEIGIAPGHTPLLSPLVPGAIRYAMSDKSESSFYVSGGIIEVQPSMVTVLADEVIRAEDLDENYVLDAEKKAKENLASLSNDSIDYVQAMAEVSRFAAQAKLVKSLQSLRK